MSRLDCDVYFWEQGIIMFTECERRGMPSTKGLKSQLQHGSFGDAPRAEVSGTAALYCVSTTHLYLLCGQRFVADISSSSGQPCKQRGGRQQVAVVVIVAQS